MRGVGGDVRKAFAAVGEVQDPRACCLQTITAIAVLQGGENRRTAFGGNADSMRTSVGTQSQGRGYSVGRALGPADCSAHMRSRGSLKVPFALLKGLRPSVTIQTKPCVG